MVEKKTIIDQIEVTRSGRVQIRFAKQLVDGAVVLSSEWHRSAVDPGTDPDTQIAAVNAHLVQLGCEPVSDDGMIGVLRTTCATLHTPEVIAAWQAARAAEQSQ